MKRKEKCLLAALLAALLALGAAPLSLAESETNAQDMLPTLYITLQYDDPTIESTIHAVATVECRYPADPSGSSSGAPDTQISISAQNGMFLLEGTPAKISAGHIACGASYSFALDLGYDESQATERNEEGNIEPVLQITALSSEIGGCEYTCVFDITPTPRAYLYGINTTPDMQNSWLMARTIEGLAERLEGLYFDGQNIGTQSRITDISDPEACDFWSGLEQMKGFEPDANDVSYLYLLASPSQDKAGLRVIKEGRTADVSYAEIFAWLAENMKGRVIVFLDSAYAGRAVRDAASAGLDADYYSIIGVSMPTADTAETSVSTFFGGMLGAKLALFEGESASTGSLALWLSGNDDSNQMLTTLTSSGMVAYSYGNASNGIFALDPEWDSGVRILAVKDENCVPYVLDALELYYRYLREEAVPKEGLATTGTEILGKDCRNWVNMCELGASGFISAMVCDFDRNGTQDMVTLNAVLTEETDVSCYSHKSSYYKYDLHFCWELRLYQIENGKVVLADKISCQCMIPEKFSMIYQGSANMYVGESEGIIHIRVGSAYCGTDTQETSSWLWCRVDDGRLVDEVREEGLDIDRVGAARLSRLQDKEEAARLDEAMHIVKAEYEEITSDKYVYKVDEKTELAAILSGEIPARYFEPVVCPDYASPEENEGCAALLNGIRQALETIYPEVEESRTDALTSFALTTPDGIHISLQCTDEGLPTSIDIRTYTGTDEWEDEFRAVLQAILARPEVGLTESEIAACNAFRWKNGTDFDAPGGRARLRFNYEPMNNEGAILTVYINR